MNYSNKNNKLIMKKINSLSIIAITLVISFTSCTKKDDTAPVISLSTPVDQQDFAIGDTIFIHGDVTDNEALHELMVSLTQEESGAVVLDYMPTVHDMPSFHIDTFFVPTDTVHVHFDLKVEAWDHDDNKSELNYTLHWAD